MPEFPLYLVPLLCRNYSFDQLLFAFIHYHILEIFGLLSEFYQTLPRTKSGQAPDDTCTISYVQEEA
jgi:hypothetical protein